MPLPQGDEGLTHLRGRGVAVALKQPVAVEPLLELPQSLPQLLDHLERPHPQELLVESPDESLGHPVALGGTDETWAGLDA